jgi:hypothetical protein
MRRPWYRSGLLQTLAVFLTVSAVGGLSLTTTRTEVRRKLPAIWGPLPAYVQVQDSQGHPVANPAARVIDGLTGQEKLQLDTGPTVRSGEPEGTCVIQLTQAIEWERGHDYRLFWIWPIRKLEYEAVLEISAEGFVPQRISMACFSNGQRPRLQLLRK